MLVRTSTPPSFHPVDDTVQASEGSPQGDEGSGHASSKRPAALPHPGPRGQHPQPAHGCSKPHGRGGESTQAAPHVPRAEMPRAQARQQSACYRGRVKKQEKKEHSHSHHSRDRDPGISLGQPGPRCPEGQRLSWGRGGQL